MFHELHRTELFGTLIYCTSMHWFQLIKPDLPCTESVYRREGSTGKYQHEVEEVPKGAARGNYLTIGQFYMKNF